MSKEEWKRRYVDTHKGLSAVGHMLEDSKKRKNNIVDPSDLNAKNVKHLKKPIERKCFEDRAKDAQHFVMDTLAVRAEDMLDKTQLPAKDLLKIATGLIPKTLNVQAETKVSFLSLYDTVDIPKAEETSE